MRPSKIRSRTTIDHLTDLLRREGLLAASDLTTRLQTTPSTLSRLLKHKPQQLMRFGKTSTIKYGWLRPVPTLPPEIPVFRVNEKGNLDPVATLFTLSAKKFLIEPGARAFSAIPPEINTLVPQGFLGRAFARSFSDELQLPPRLQDWSDDHALIAVCRRGEDLAGSVISGAESAERWLKLRYPESKRSQYPDLAERSFEGQPTGLSAGGEQPKFCVVVDGNHKLVKFAGLGASEADVRWKDLLICEFWALQTLQQHGIAAAKADLIVNGKMVFLEIDRFDRIGLTGRRSLISMEGVDAHFFGQHDRWALTAQRLEQRGLLSGEDLNRIKCIQAFSSLIADTDRHYQNISFFVDPSSSPASDFEIRHLTLAPIYDKLPMLFAPIDGRVLPRQFTARLPDPETIEVWEKSKKMAMDFWNQVTKDNRISRGFRGILEECASVVG